MADIKKFVTKSSLVGVGESKRSSLMEKIHADKITIKYMSRDGLVALIQKQRQQIKSRSALNDALLQNIKQAQSLTKSFTEKTSSLPELQPAKLKKSTSSLAGSKTLIRALSPDVSRIADHGFQYRSSGDLRLSVKKTFGNTAKKYEQWPKQTFQSLKQSLLKATMIHCRDHKGEYTFRPMLHEILKKESRVARSASDTSENVDAFRFMTNSYRYRRDLTPKPKSETMLFGTNSFREKPLIGRRYYVKENNRFINDMMLQIYLLERDSCMQTNTESQFETGENFETPLRRGTDFVRSEPNFRSARNLSPINSPETSMIRAKSSFNIRYGVPSNILESRKPLLDEYMQQELIKTSQTDVEINDYIRDVQEFTANRSFKNEAKRNNPYGFWQSEASSISDTQKTAMDGEVSQSEINPGSI
ncbi:hypothetical protein BsWGS_28029 [Bradybaena similaris]